MHEHAHQQHLSSDFLSTDRADAEVLNIGGAALVRLAERQWGPSAAAPPAATAAVQQAGIGGQTDGTIAVLREAFSPYAQKQRQLSDVRALAALGW